MMTNRTIEQPPNVAGVLQHKVGRIHSTGARLHIVGTIGKKLSKLVFILYFEF